MVITLLLKRRLDDFNRHLKHLVDENSQEDNVKKVTERLDDAMQMHIRLLVTVEVVDDVFAVCIFGISRCKCKAALEPAMALSHNFF